MVQEIHGRTEFEACRPVFAGLDCHLAVNAIIEGSAPGRIIVDDPDRPQAALAWTKDRFHLAGASDSDEFGVAVRRLFLDEIYPQAQAAGDVDFVLYYAPDTWENAIEAILEGKNPIKGERRYLLFADALPMQPRLPAGFSLRTVDRALLADTRLKNLDNLMSEMCSERPSVEDFLAHSFGVCVLHGDELAGWCLSEYNSGDRCEVGIETLPAYQKRGLGTAMTCALLEEARRSGIRQIGWDCWASNMPSIATALRAGFRSVAEYPTYFAWFNEADNLAVNGNARLRLGQYAESLAWFDRAFACGQTTGWTYWAAACAAAMCGRLDAASDYLAKAIDAGFADAERMAASAYLGNLRGTDGWQGLLRRAEEWAHKQ